MFDELAVDVFLNGLSGLLKIDFNKDSRKGCVLLAARKVQASRQQQQRKKQEG